MRYSLDWTEAEVYSWASKLYNKSGIPVNVSPPHRGSSRYKRVRTASYAGQWYRSSSLPRTGANRSVKCHHTSSTASPGSLSSSCLRIGAHPDIIVPPQQVLQQVQGSVQCPHKRDSQGMKGKLHEALQQVRGPYQRPAPTQGLIKV